METSIQTPVSLSNGTEKSAVAAVKEIVATIKGVAFKDAPVQNLDFLTEEMQTFIQENANNRQVLILLEHELTALEEIISGKCGVYQDKYGNYYKIDRTYHGNMVEWIKQLTHWNHQEWMKTNLPTRIGALGQTFRRVKDACDALIAIGPNPIQLSPPIPQFHHPTNALLYKTIIFATKDTKNPSVTRAMLATFSD